VKQNSAKCKNNWALAKIVRGVSTKAEVIALLGKPSGGLVYPITPQEGVTVMTYTYGEERYLAYHEHKVIVTLNSQNVVIFVSYSIDGERQL